MERKRVDRNARKAENDLSEMITITRFGSEGVDHIRFMRVWSLFVLSLLFVHTSNAAAIRVLFIGNSYIYSNDLPSVFRQLALSLGDTVETGMSAPGGHTFEQHTTNTTTQAAIAQGNWDFVVLQEQSQRPAFPPAQVATEVYPFAAQLVEQIRAANSCTEIVFMMTWGRENGDQANCASYPPLCTFEGMQQRLRDSYVEMAVDNASWCAPIGAVWRRYRELFPTVGLYADGSHPNQVGTYMAANTLAASMFRRSTTEATYVPTAIALDQAQTIRALASAIVADSASTWNIGVNDPQAELNWNDVGGGSILFANNTSGAASQTWDLGDGSTSTDADPLHQYQASGVYTVTLITFDACGRTDTASALVNVILNGVADRGSPQANLVVWNGEQLVITNSAGAVQFELLDGRGRLIRSQQLSTGTHTIARDGLMSGTLLWRMTSARGERQAGKVILP